MLRHGLFLVALCIVLANLSGCLFIMVDPPVIEVCCEILNGTNRNIALQYQSHDQRDRETARVVLSPGGRFYRNIHMVNTPDECPTIRIQTESSDEVIAPLDLTIDDCPYVMNILIREGVLVAEPVNSEDQEEEGEAQ